MDDETKQLEEVITAVISFIERSEDFVTEQTPLLVNEILTFNTYKHSIWLLSSIIMFLIGVRLLNLARRESKNPEGEEIVIAISLFMGLILLILGMLISVDESIRIIKIHVAPRLYLLDYLRGVIK